MHNPIVLHHHVGALPGAIRTGRPGLCTSDGGNADVLDNAGNSTDSVDENARAERPSRCPPGGVRPRLSTAPRGARPEPHPRQHRGFLAHLGARLRRAGQSSRAPRTPFRSAATVLAVLTTLVLSLGFVPPANAHNHYVRCPGLGRTSRGLECNAHRRSHHAERFGNRIRLQRRAKPVRFPIPSFEFDSRPATVTRMDVHELLPFSPQILG